MARPIRIEYAGAVYHVRARGNQGRPIFADDLGRKRWLETLAEACEKTGWRIPAHVLTRPRASQPAGDSAWWLRGRTTTGRRWVGERLWMGDDSVVSRAVRAVQAGRAGELQSLNCCWDLQWSGRAPLKVKKTNETATRQYTSSDR